MGPDINAIGIIFAPIFAIAVSLIWRTTPDNARFVRAILIPVLIIILTAIITKFLPEDWGLVSSLQLFLPIVCLFPVLWLVGNRTVKYAAVCVLFLLAISLSVQYVHLARSSRVSLIQPERGIAIDNFQQMSVCFALYAVASNDSNYYPEGWLLDSPVMAKLPEKYRKAIEEHNKFDNPETYRLWHTPFTRMYGVKKKYQELWYPGGKLSQDTIGNMSRRDRPGKMDNK
ncbi:MAG: hypothetical protein PHY02_02685 [Phycisphaerae bacterium]|nr:hypothetical protein [Phycisphaerae bacterium]